MMTGPDNRIRTKSERMDQYLEARKSEAAGIGVPDIVAAVNEIYNIDLESAPLLGAASAEADKTDARTAIGAWLEQCGRQAAGAEIRTMINESFGINLDAISALDGAGISLFSKGQWIVRDDSDLFIVYTGEGDLDVRISPAPSFVRQTGAKELPDHLVRELVRLGFDFEPETGSCYYLSPTGEAVPDAFKGQTMKAVLDAIRQTRSH
ncbi:hypothetical protein ACFSL6_03280 [Paenibacillus thailandensis]|uniref:Uncharacterized protein n=1 Tax=Paenibacillus thailandensis TaxID=393250 RepID=A0ABW5R4C3_9BACL